MDVGPFPDPLPPCQEGPDVRHQRHLCLSLSAAVPRRTTLQNWSELKFTSEKDVKSLLEKKEGRKIALDPSYCDCRTFHKKALFVRCFSSNLTIQLSLPHLVRPLCTHRVAKQKRLTRCSIFDMSHRHTVTLSDRHPVADPRNSLDTLYKVGGGAHRAFFCHFEGAPQKRGEEIHFAEPGRKLPREIINLLLKACRL